MRGSFTLLTWKVFYLFLPTYYTTHVKGIISYCFDDDEDDDKEEDYFFI